MNIPLTQIGNICSKNQKNNRLNRNKQYEYKNNSKYKIDIKEYIEKYKS